MKILFSYTRADALRVSAFLLASGMGLAGAQAAENWMLATPEALPGPINLPISASATPCVSADGLTLHFSSDRPGGYGLWDLWVSERGSKQDNWGEPVNLGPEVNTSAPEGMPTLSADGLTLYFGDGNPMGWAGRNGSATDYQIWTTTRASRQSPWRVPVEVEQPVNSPYADYFPHLSADGLHLYFASVRPEAYGFNVAQRTSRTGPWLTVTSLGSSINAPGHWAFPCLSSDELRLIFQSDRSGGRGGLDIWMASRQSTTDDWSPPVNLGPQVNSGYYDVSACVSADFPAIGSYLLFARNDVNGWNNRFKIYRADVIPNMTLLRSSTANGPWTPVDASFVNKSIDSYEAEASVGPASDQSFYRVMMTGNEGALRITSSTKFGLQFRVQFEWVR